MIPYVDIWQMRARRRGCTWQIKAGSMSGAACVCITFRNGAIACVKTVQAPPEHSCFEVACSNVVKLHQNISILGLP